MAIISVTTQGASVKKISRRVIIEKEENTLLEIPVENLSGLVTFGNVSFSNQALSLLANNGVPVTYLAYNGKPKGMFLPVVNKNIDLRYLQYSVYNSPLSVGFAKEFVVSKLENSISFFKSVKKNHNIEDFDNYLSVNKNFIERITASTGLNEIIGYEGSASKAYFNIYARLFKKDLKFTKRTKRPPKDEVNSLLSFGYVMLHNLINSICHAAGLDTYTGFLHKEHYNRPSLASDFLEIYRAQVIDRMVLNLCNKKIIKQEDFSTDENLFRLEKSGMQKFLESWTNTIHTDNKGITLIDSVTQNINILIKAIRTGTEPKFKGIK